MRSINIINGRNKFRLNIHNEREAYNYRLLDATDASGRYTSYYQEPGNESSADNSGRKSIEEYRTCDPFVEEVANAKMTQWILARAENAWRVTGFGKTTDSGAGDLFYVIGDPYEPLVLAGSQVIYTAECVDSILSAVLNALFSLHSKGLNHGEVGVTRIGKIGNGYALLPPTKAIALQAAENLSADQDMLQFGLLILLLLSQIPTSPSGDFTQKAIAKWQTVAIHCTNPDVAKRWTAARAMVGESARRFVDAFWIESDEGSARVCWCADVGPTFLVDSREIDHPPGSVIQVIPELRQWGNESGKPGVRIGTDWIGQRFRAVTSVLANKAWVVGSEISISQVPEVIQLSAFVEAEVQLFELRWKWPTLANGHQAKLARVVVDASHYPSSVDDGDHSFVVTYSHYRNVGCFRFEVPLGKAIELFVAVFCCASGENGMEFSSGATTQCRHKFVFVDCTVRSSPRGHDLVFKGTKDMQLPPYILSAASSGHEILRQPRKSELKANVELVHHYDVAPGQVLKTPLIVRFYNERQGVSVVAKRRITEISRGH